MPHENQNLIQNPEAGSCRKGTEPLHGPDPDCGLGGGIRHPAVSTGEARADVISGCLLSYLAAVVIQQCYAAFRQSRTNPYSYNIIYYRGFFLFFLVLLGMTIQYCKGIFQVPEAFTALDLIWYLTDSTVTYLFCSIPAVVAFSVWLCVSNICLIRHEGKRLVNVLGILLAFSMTGTLLLLVYFGALHPNWVTGKYRFVLNLVMNLCSVFYLYLQCMLIGSFLAVFSVAYCEPDTDRDYIIVLGCGIRKDGTPTPLLRGRIDRAIAFYEKQKKTTGQMPGFVTSGGQGADECISECASMKAYLLEHGIPKEQIIEEDQSENTYQNMLYSELTGERTNLYIPLEYQMQNGENAKKDGEKTYLLSIPQGNYAIYGNLPWYYTGSGTPTLELNGSMEIEYNSWLSPSVFYIPTTTGETEARVTVKGNIYTAEGTEQFYALDLDLLGNVTEKIRTASAGVSAETENGHLKVSATAAGDGERLILTVPRDAGWKILKNGESVQPYVWEGLFYVFELNEGSNTIEMNYHVPFVREGAVISLLALVILALYPDRRKSAKNAVQRDG